MATAAAAVTVPNALTAMKDSDDSIAEIDAMIPRLLKMKKQLIAQKEYIEVAIKSASEGPFIHASGDAADATKASAAADLNGGKCVDYRVNLYKHRNLISRLSTDANLGALTDVHAAITDATEATEAASALTKMQTRAKKNGGDESTGGIFKAGQFIEDLVTTVRAASPATDPEKQDTNVFNGVDLQCTKRFLIGVNSILTQPNNTNEIGTTGSDFKAAIDNGSGGSRGNINGNYAPGGKHIISSGTLRGLLMQGNTDTTFTDDANGDDARDALGTAASAPTEDQLKKIRGFGL